MVLSERLLARTGKEEAEVKGPEQGSPNREALRRRGRTIEKEIKNYEKEFERLEEALREEP